MTGYIMELERQEEVKLRGDLLSVWQATMNSVCVQTCVSVCETEVCVCVHVLVCACLCVSLHVCMRVYVCVCLIAVPM